MQDILSCSFASNPSLLLFVPGIKPAKLLKTVVLISSDIISSVRSPLRDIVVGKIRGEWKKIQGGRKKYFSNVLRSLAKIFAFPRKT